MLICDSKKKNYKFKDIINRKFSNILESRIVLIDDFIEFETDNTERTTYAIRIFPAERYDRLYEVEEFLRKQHITCKNIYRDDSFNVLYDTGYGTCVDFVIMKDLFNQRMNKFLEGGLNE